MPLAALLNENASSLQGLMAAVDALSVLSPDVLATLINVDPAAVLSASHSTELNERDLSSAELSLYLRSDEEMQMVQRVQASLPDASPAAAAAAADAAPVTVGSLASKRTREQSHGDTRGGNDAAAAGIAAAVPASAAPSKRPRPSSST
jgi:hypothetical protein